MKKLLTLILALTLVGCSTSKGGEEVSEATAKRYNEMINLLQTQTEFKSEDSSFSVSSEIAKVEEGYRYYVFIDNPKIAMYNVEAIVIVGGTDYTNLVASNIGIFDDTKYNLVPNQVKIEDGYAKGLMLSGISKNSRNELYLFVQWRDISLTNISKSFIHISANYSGAN